MLSVLIDQREPITIQTLTFGSAPVVVGLLDYGDVQVLCDDGALLVVERKTPDDLLNSIIDGRLFNQLAGCLMMSAWTYLIIDGHLRRSDSGYVITETRETKFSWSAVQGALLTAQELGANVLQTIDDFEKTIVWLSKRKHETFRVSPRRTFVFASLQEQVLSSLPGIGDEKARDIMSAHGGNLTWALCSLLDPEWERQPGVGPKTKENLRQLFALQENELLWPYYRDEPESKPERIKTS